jgi:hypothetical protein
VWWLIRGDKKVGKKEIKLKNEKVVEGDMQKSCHCSNNLGIRAQTS